MTLKLEIDLSNPESRQDVAQNAIKMLMALAASQKAFPIERAGAASKAGGGTFTEILRQEGK